MSISQTLSKKKSDDAAWRWGVGNRQRNSEKWAGVRIANEFGTEGENRANESQANESQANEIDPVEKF